MIKINKITKYRVQNRIQIFIMTFIRSNRNFVFSTAKRGQTCTDGLTLIQDLDQCLRVLLLT